MKIKDVELNDIDTIIEAEKTIFKEDAFDKEVMISLITNSTFFIKLVDDNHQDEIIGYAICLRDLPLRVNLINFLIRRKYQNKGYGTILLNYVIQRIRKTQRIKQIVLNVNTQNSSAIRLYERHNFRIIKKIENYYHNDESAYLMSLKL